MLLACAATAASVAALVRGERPETAVAALAISATSLTLLTAAWLAKRRLAKTLESAVLASDATCSLACACLAGVLLVGSVAFTVAPGAWWVDAAAALALAVLFAREGAVMARAALSPSFTRGGCGCG